MTKMNSFESDLAASAEALELNTPMQLVKDFRKYTGIVYLLDQFNIPQMIINPTDPAFVKTLKSAGIYLMTARTSDLIKIWTGW